VIIKVLLVAALLGAAVMLVRGRPTALNLLVRRSLTLSVIVAGIVAVLVPSALTTVATTVGVGRGTDLVLYVLSVTFLFVSISLYLRLGQLHDQQVELARRHALLEAELREREGRENR
jgi:small membrane protein